MKYIYFIRRADGMGPIKIGCSYQPRNRLMSCQSWSPVKLELIARAHGDFYHERALHDKFAISRSHGEWFNPTAELIDLIAAINAGSTLDDLGIQRAKILPGNSCKASTTREKQALTLRLTFARKRAEGLNPVSMNAARIEMPKDVAAALEAWREAMDVSELVEERSIIERHITELKALA